jgi:hypothetical protein
MRPQVVWKREGASGKLGRSRMDYLKNGTIQRLGRRAFVTRGSVGGRSLCAVNNVVIRSAGPGRINSTAPKGVEPVSVHWKFGCRHANVSATAVAGRLGGQEQYWDPVRSVVKQMVASWHSASGGQGPGVKGQSRETQAAARVTPRAQPVREKRRTLDAKERLQKGESLAKR